MRHEARIPDHDREAISEALEAALYRAAFQRMEEAEMKQLLSEMNRGEKNVAIPADLRRRLKRRRGWADLRRNLPRVAQAAAAIIAVLSIGTGIALATSPQARQWAAGVLQSRVIDPDGFFGEVRSSLTDGAAVGGKLVVVEDNARISVYDGAGAAPVVYEWHNAGNRRIDALAAEGDSAWVLYRDDGGEPIEAFDLERMPERYGLGRVTLGGDGAFDVAELADVPAKALLDPEGRRLNSYGISGAAMQDGRLLFATHYAVESESEGFSFKPANVRLFSWDTANGTLSELDLTGVPLDWEPELFGGGYLAAFDDGDAGARVFRIDGGGFEEVCRVPYSGVERPKAFALRESDNALLYVLDGSVYLAPGMDPSRAARVAVCGELNGRGLLPDDDTYAVVHGDEVRLFDLTAPLGEVDELVVDGDSLNYRANQRFIAGHPGVAVVSDPGRTTEGFYADLMLAGRASGDVVTLEDEGFRRVRDAGLIAPLTDPVLIAEWEKLPEGLRATLSVDGRPAAIPGDLYAYPDVVFLPETWVKVCGRFEDYPDTWLDYASWLAEFSHGDAAGQYPVDFERFERIDLDAPAQFEMFTLWNMAEAYARCWQAMGEPIDFTRPEFVECVEALSGVDWGALRFAEDDGGGHGRAVTFISVYDPLFSEDDHCAGYRTLRIRPDAPRISRISGTFAFMPASCTRRATAQAYLETLATVNRTAIEGSLPEAASYDFATASETMVGEAGGSVTADSVRRYRVRVGDVAFRAEPSREGVLAVRDAAVGYVSGEATRDELLESLNEVYR